MRSYFLCIAFVVTSLSSFAQKGEDTNIFYKVHSDSGNHYLVKYLPYGSVEVDENGKVYKIAIVTVFYIESYFDGIIKLKLTRIGRSFAHYYLKSDAYYVEEQIQVAKDDAKKYPKEYGLIPLNRK